MTAVTDVETWSASTATPDWHDREIRTGINRYARDRKLWPQHEDVLAFLLDQWLRSITHRSEQYDRTEAWVTDGGYSPSGNSWICPRKDCGYGVAGLDSRDEDDWSDPVGDHLAEHDRADQETGVDRG